MKTETLGFQDPIEDGFYKRRCQEKKSPLIRSERSSRHRALFGTCIPLARASWGLRRFPFGVPHLFVTVRNPEAAQAAVRLGANHGSI